MRAEIEERKTVLLSTGQQPAGQDIFTMLVKANEDEDAKFKLTENELVCLVPFLSEVSGVPITL